jgi:hypothetical protein
MIGRDDGSIDPVELANQLANTSHERNTAQRAQVLERDALAATSGGDYDQDPLSGAHAWLLQSSASRQAPRE